MSYAPYLTGLTPAKAKAAIRALLGLLRNNGETSLSRPPRPALR